MHIGTLVPVSDMARSRAFYEEELGGQGKETPGGWQVDYDGGSCLYLLDVGDQAGTAGWPLASFRVPDVRARTRELKERGVSFLNGTEIPFDLDEDDVKADPNMEVSWFRDPDGNVLTLFRVATG